MADGSMSLRKRDKMNSSDLQKILEGAPVCAHIELTFVCFITPRQLGAQERAILMLEHFMKTFRIVIVKKDEGRCLMTIAKTPLFKPQDAEELSRHLAAFLTKVVTRDTPKHEITLETGEKGWQLRCKGGNKLLRDSFQAICVAANKFFPVGPQVILNQKGVVIMGLSSGTEGDVLNFSQAVAETLGTELIL